MKQMKCGNFLGGTIVKYYAVKSGRKSGIFETWEEAEAQVKGFPNAKFKSFTSMEEAEDYLENLNNKKGSQTTAYTAYVDGSFDKTLNIYGSGVVILHNQEVIKEISFSGSNENYIESFQVAGEVLASIRAIEWAIENNVPELTICYDYEGIRSWALGEWKTNKQVSKDYKKKFDSLAGKIKIHFNKVRAHSGIYFNELADELAKKAIKDNVTLPKVSEEEMKTTNSDLYQFLSNSELTDKKENLIHIGEFIISEKKILKFIKEKWKSEGRKVGEIKRLSYDLDLNQKIYTMREIVIFIGKSLNMAFL